MLQKEEFYLCQTDVRRIYVRGYDSFEKSEGGMKISNFSRERVRSF